jgi:hypothetical protein
MKRQYFISDNLDDLALIESQLEDAGISTPQIHILSNDDAGVTLKQLNEVEAVLRKDVVHGTTVGAMIGAACAAAILLLAWTSGLTASYTWLPPFFLAVAVLGFCTWEGGLIGIQEPNVNFRRFQNELKQGKHILLVDVAAEHETALRRVTHQHGGLIAAGEGESTPGWVIGAQQKWTRFMELAP